MIKYVSFDLDATLVNDKFDKLIWHEEVPKLYAKQHKIGVAEAKQFVYSQYYRALDIERVSQWTSITYWFKRLKLGNWQKLLSDMKKHIFVFDDTIPTLDYLKKKYKLIITSNSEKKFFELKLEAEELSKYFDHVFSAPTSFNRTRKDKEMFRAILKKLKIKPSEIVHIGDDRQLDYVMPTELGIKSFLLDRTKKAKGKNVIHSLLELKRIL
ncbi:MAG: HAD family hydrolase [Candidatus Woesearchaeota archaeon]